MITVNFNLAGLELGARQLSRVTNRTLSEVLEQLAGLVVRDCQRFTPPFSQLGNNNESWATQRKMGRDRVTKDLDRMFLKPELLDDDPYPLAAVIRKLLRKGDIIGANELLARGKWKEKAIREPNSELHNAQRNSRGRVKSRPDRYFVAEAASRRAYFRKMTDRVGLAKAGWNRAALALGRVTKDHIPKWVLAHNAPGVFLREGSPSMPAIVVGNSVPYIQDTAARLDLIRRAYRYREKNLPKMMHYALLKSAREARVKAA
jgi:hypothetical protein